MRKATVRNIPAETGDGKWGTFSLWESDSGFSCYILERPPISQIGKAINDHPRILDAGGVAVATLFQHPQHGLCYELVVDGRTGILVHPGNWFQELLGCLAPGNSIADVIDWSGKWLGHPGKSQRGVTSSASDALPRLLADLAGESVKITFIR